MNNLESKSTHLNITEILFEEIFQVNWQDGEEIELTNSVNQEIHPNLFQIVEVFIKNMNFLKEIHKKIQESTNLENYKKEKIDSIHKLLFQDRFFLTYIQYIFSQYVENITDLESLDKKLWNISYINLLHYGILEYCYGNNSINWNDLNTINQDISIKIELEKKFDLEYGMEEEINYPLLFKKDMNGLKDFFKENDNSQIDLSKKVLYIDQDDSSDYIKQQVKYELMYTLGGELPEILDNKFNESWLADILIHINRKWLNLNTNQVIQTIQDECKSLFQLVNFSDNISEKESYNKELGDLEEFIKEINFSYGQIELIKTKLTPFIQEYISTLLILEENNFQIEEDMKDIFENLIQKGQEVDAILEYEWISALSTKLTMISFLKRNLEKDILLKKIYKNCLEQNYVIAYNQIMEYIEVFWNNSSINLLKQHINIENIVNTKIEILFQKLNAFENPTDILEELKDLKTQLNKLDKSSQINQNLEDIEIFLDGNINLAKKNLWINKEALEQKNKYIKAKIEKRQNNIDNHIKLALNWNLESIEKLWNLQDFPYQNPEFNKFLEVLAEIKNCKWNIIKTIIKLDQYVKQTAETNFLKKIVREHIKEKIEIIFPNIKELIEWIWISDNKESVEIIKWILWLEAWKKISQDKDSYEINPTYLEYIYKELEKNGDKTSLLKLYKKLFFREITITEILEDEEKVSNLFKNKGFATNLQKVYQILKKINKESIIILILEEYILTQDQEKIEKHLQNLFTK